MSNYILQLGKKKNLPKEEYVVWEIILYILKLGAAILLKGYSVFNFQSTQI